MMSNVIDTIMKHLRCQGLDKLTLTGLGLRMLVKMDDNNLRLHFKARKGVINIDIHYDQGLDLYVVKAHKLNPQTLDVKTRESGEVYFDQFAELFREVFEAAR